MGLFTLQNNLKRVFTGSLVQVQAIETRLLDHQIKGITKNHYNSGIMAGFGASSQVQLFVDKRDYKIAYQIVSDYLSDYNLKAV
ncbi:DUF2007 domain-containing protein [Pseudofulvibacter geojedonensis]|uniref:DUF2007 domain-containing protein n=1 Tax=Pseudofulvibacter geojedonensis TaxID=1123758 RepID=A0ABW3I2N8_9FLAO